MGIDDDAVILLSRTIHFRREGGKKKVGGVVFSR